MNTVIATFATRAFAQQAADELRNAGFEAVSIDVHVTPEAVEAASQPLPENPSLVGVAGVNTGASSGYPGPVAVPLVVETLEANATARMTLKTEDREDRVNEAIAIINNHGGAIENERAAIAQSTQEEVANAAQASNRLK
jgi:hypothetical protein